MQKILNYINGELQGPQSGQYLDNYAPATGKVYSLVPDSDSSDVDAAVAAAERAAPLWASATPQVRAQYLKELAKIIRDDAENFARIESIDSGKPISLARSLDIPRSSQNFDFFADIIHEFHGESFATNENVFNYTVQSPLGPVGCISPWNLPLYLFTWKIAPALVTGNTVVAKPSELTPMTAFKLSEAAIKAKLPPGVLNIVHGLGAKVGASLVAHSKIKAVSFTGSTVTGRAIAQVAATQFKKVSLEMGGKNANVIFADCDFEKAVAMTVRSSFLNQGQICLCGSRILVEQSLYEKFRDALIEKVKSLKQKDPLADDAEQGAVVSETHMNKILSYIEMAKGEGAKILTGGGRAEISGECSDGYFVKPTLIEGLGHKSRVNQEEIFGPVATIMPFSDESEALALANSTRYGLSASVWTQNIDRGHRFAARLEVGVVWLNTWMMRDLRTPFGGVKESGMGREGGLYGLKFFTETKNVCLDMQRGAP